MPDALLSDKKIDVKKIPLWLWLALGGGALVGVLLLLRSRAAPSTAQPVSGDVTTIFSGLSTEISKLQSDMTTKLADLTAQQKTALDTAIGTVKTTIDDLTKRLSTLETTTAGLGEQVSGAISAQGALGMRIKALEDGATALRQQISTGAANYTQVLAQVQALQTALNTLLVSSRQTRLAYQYEIQTAIDGARAQLGQLDAHWKTASPAEIIKLLGEQTNLMAGQPLRDLLLSLVPNSSTLTGYDLPGVPVTLPVASPIPGSGTDIQGDPWSLFHIISDGGAIIPPATLPPPHP